MTVRKWDVRAVLGNTYVRTLMVMAMTASKLRENIYRILDQVLETGVPVVIERNGCTLRIVADDPPSKLGLLDRRPEVVIGDPADLVELDWSSEWSP